MNALDAFRKFALSIDIINDELLKSAKIERIISNISRNLVGADYFEATRAHPIDKRLNYVTATITL